MLDSSSTTAIPAHTADDGRRDDHRVLHALLDDALRLPAEYGDGLSSHLPMALEALHALGADDTRLRQFARNYARRFTAAPMVEPAVAAPVLGRFDHFAAWQHHYAALAAAHGADRALRDALGQLMPGVAAAAFHGLIRVGHAVRSGHVGELHAALAYFACRYQPTASLPGGPPLVAADWLAALGDIAARGAPAPGALISARMAHWAEDPEVQAIAGRLAPEALLDVAVYAAQCYVITRNFTVLHVITASAALQRLLSWLDPPSLQPVPPAVATALLASGALAAPAAASQVPGGRVLDWSALAHAAIEQDDDHVIKLTLACRELDALRPDLVWRRAAARALAL